MPLIGDTVRLKVTFRDFDDTKVDPTAIILQMYDGDKEPLGNPITIPIENREELGIYFYDYTIPSGHRKLYYEFTGTLQGKPSVAREEMRVIWI